MPRRPLIRYPALALAMTLAVTLALAATAAPGQGADQGSDPMHSAECHRALDILQAQENAMLVPHPAADPRPAPFPGSPLDGVWRNAARACLGGNGDPPLPKTIALPPIVVSPIVVSRPAPPRPMAVTPTAPPPRRAEPPVFISTCDAGGCWASDGTRLIRAGANLVGPHGLCSGTAGTLLNCP